MVEFNIQAIMACLIQSQFMGYNLINLDILSFYIQVLIKSYIFIKQNKQFTSIKDRSTKQYMDNEFKAYAKLISDFYSKIIKGHSRIIDYTQDFNAILKQIQSKDCTNLNTFEMTRKKSEISLAASVNSHSRNSKSMGKRRAKSRKQMIFTHKNFGTVLAFSYMHFILTVENRQIFKMIQTKIQLLCNQYKQQKEKDNPKWQHSLMQWKKVMHLIEHKNSVKWQKILSTAFLSFQDSFTDMILCSILNLNINSKIQLKPDQKTLQRISDVLKVTIIFCEMQKQEIKQKKIIGQYESAVKIGSSQTQGTKYYTCFDKFPKQQPQTNQTTTIGTPTKKTQIKSNRQIKLKQQPQPPRNQQGQQLVLVQKPSPKRQVKSYSKIDSTEERSQRTIDRVNGNGNGIGYTRLNSGVSGVNANGVGNRRVSRNGSGYSLVKKKYLLTVQFLLRQYNSDNSKLQTLQCFKIEEQKQKLSGKTSIKNSKNSQNIQSP